MIKPPHTLRLTPYAYEPNRPDKRDMSNVETRPLIFLSFQKYHSLGIWFTHIAQCRRGNFHEIGYEDGSCPRVEWTIKRIVSIPTHFRMVHLANLISEISKLDRISNRLYYYKK